MTGRLYSLYLTLGPAHKSIISNYYALKDQ